MTDVELVKSKLDIVDFLSGYITLKKAGRNFKANCPFHQEKTPSFIVSPERQSWHCFGACNEGGDVISFLQKWENIEFVEALKILAKQTGVTLSQFTPTESSRVKEKLYEINHLAAEFYHFILMFHAYGKRAKEYAKSRDLKDGTIKTFLLGYAPSSWDSLLRFLTKKGYTAQDIHTAGLLTRSEAGRYFDRFRGRLMFPLKDSRGNIAGFAGRLLDEEVYPERERGAKYINTAETPIYVKGNMLYGLDVTKEAIKKEKEAVVVEGEIDLLASYQAGVSHVVAIKGSAFTQEQVLLLKRYTEKVILALDSDFAGSEAARRGIEIADASGLTVRVVQLPFGKDPAECIAKSPHLWIDAVKKAVPIYDFVIESSLSKYDKADAYGKKQIAQVVLPFLVKINNLIVQSHYIKKLAKELDVTEESIAQSMKTIDKIGVLAAAAPQVSKPKDRGLLLEEQLLALIIQSENAKEVFTGVSVLSADDFSQPALSQIWKSLSSYFQKHTTLDIKVFGKTLSAQLIAMFDMLCLMDVSFILSDEKRFRHEIGQTIKAIKQLSLRRKIVKIATDIREAEEKLDNEKANQLQKELRQLLLAIQSVEKGYEFPVQ